MFCPQFHSTISLDKAKPMAKQPNKAKIGMTSVLTIHGLACAQERRERHRQNFMHITIHTSQTWADTFISELNDTHVEAELRTRHIPPLVCPPPPLPHPPPTPQPPPPVSHTPPLTQQLHCAARDCVAIDLFSTRPDVAFNDPGSVGAPGMLNESKLEGHHVFHFPVSPDYCHQGHT